MNGVTLIALWATAALQQAPGTVARQTAHADTITFDLLKYSDRVERDGTRLRTEEVKVLLNSAQWVSVFGQIGSLYLEGYGDVKFEDIAIDKPDGRHITVTNAMVEDVNPYGVTPTSLSADVRFKKLTIPGLEPGDHLSYRKVELQKTLAPGSVFGEIKLATMAGAPPQVYELDLPRNAGIKVHLRKGLGVEWEDVPSPPDRLVRRFLLKPSSAGGEGKPVVDMESLTDPDVIFTSFESWSEVSRWWWGISKDRLEPDAAVRKEAQELAASAQSPRDKLAALLAFTSGRVRYLNVSFGLGRMQPRKAPEVLANRYGDCKDKHALLAALATSLGMDVRPVLINSARPALHDDVPSPQQFDHVVSVARLGKTPEEWLWLDGTNPFAPPGYLMPSLRDKPALLVEANGEATLVRTSKLPPFVPRQEVTLKATLSADGVLKGQMAWLFHSDLEVTLRSAFAVLPKERRAEAIEASLARNWQGGKVENVSVSDPLDFRSPLRVEFDAEETIGARGTERTLSVPAPEFDLPEADGAPSPGEPAASFAVQEFALTAEIELPEGQQAQVPLSVSLDRPFGAFRSTYAIDGRTLKLERTLKLSRPEIGLADVPSYEAFRSAISKDHDQVFNITGVAAVVASPTAVGLSKQGKAAFDRREFKTAVELLRQATELDPKVANGFVDLGRAYCELNSYEEAIEAFTHQIEREPFHDSAYAWRGYALEQLGRWPEAERDLLKQIEVAPFYEWSYEELARGRANRGRHPEAAELYAKAAALEPNTPRHWLDLADEQNRAGRASEARQSLQKATSLELEEWMKIRAAQIHEELGDLESAGRLASEVIPSLADRLAKMKPADLDNGDAYWSVQLARAWRIVGDAAVAAGDVQRAEKYLNAAWRLQFLPEAGWALGDLREKQGRLAEAVELWSMAAGAASPSTSKLPADRQKRIAAACARLPEVARPFGPPPMKGRGAAVTAYSEPARQTEARLRLTELRTVRLKGPVVAKVTEDVVLLAAGDGRVERVVDVSRKSPQEFERQLARLDPIRVESPLPDDRVYKTVRRGLFTCSQVSGCALVLDLPNTGGLQGFEHGSIEFASVEPKAGTTLSLGARVAVVAKVHYALSVENSSVRLVVLNGPMGKPLVESQGVTLAGKEGEVTLTANVDVPRQSGELLVALVSSDRKVRGSLVSYKTR